MFCDVIEAGAEPILDYAIGPNVYSEPLTTALDPEIWSPDIEIPDKYRIDREADEYLVFHAFGNAATRSNERFNVKGSQAIIASVERMKAEGMKVRLIYATDIPNIELRYLQVQADVVVDQLNLGCYGALAREGMMLGRPTISFLMDNMGNPQRPLRWYAECPLVSARENNIYEVLKELLLAPERREAVGKLSRIYSIKWHSADACAERFERMYDRVMAGLPPMD